MTMNKVASIIFTAAILFGCAKAVTEGNNESEKLFLDAWAHLNLPGITPEWNGESDEYGIYVINEKDGDGAVVEKDGYAIVTYTVTDLEGNISSYTGKETAEQLGTYSETSYYGPQVWLTTDETIQAGLQNALLGMKVGGEKKVLIPSWMMTYSSYDSSKQYYESQSDYSNAIYDFRIEDYTKDINEWQISRMKECMDSEWGGWESFNQNVRQDTTGFFFKSLAAKDGQETDFAADTTIYINYTGRLLNGLVFDTTIERTAKDHGLYKAGNTYEPVKINWGESHGEITMGSSSSSVVSGFSLTLWNMKNLGEGDKMDKAVGIFYSPLGYGYSGSGSGIPGYAPLIFEIEIVAKPE